MYRLARHSTRAGGKPASPVLRTGAMEAVAGSLLGVLLGMRHACEPDHLAAISTLVAEERSARKGLLLGLFWGAGHTAALLGVAVRVNARRPRLAAAAARASGRSL